MQQQIVVFNEKFDYNTSAFTTMLGKAEAKSLPVNFIFREPPSQLSLQAMATALEQHGTVAEVWLTISHPNEQPVQLADYAGFVWATKINLRCHGLESLEGIQAFPRLAELYIGFSTCKALDFTPLLQCNALCVFGAEQRLTKRQMETLGELKALERLTETHGLDGNAIGVLPKLHYLSAYGLLNPETLPEKLPALRELAILRSSTLHSLDFPAGLHNLETLRVVGPVGGVESLPDMGGLTKLTSVYLRDMKRLEDVENLRTLPNLCTLRLGGNIPLQPGKMQWFTQKSFPKLAGLQLDLKSKTTAKQLEEAFYS